MDVITYGAIALFILLYGAVSKRLESTLLTGPILFVLFGYLLSEDVSSILTSKDHLIVYAITHITLILILFCDSSRIQLALFRKEEDLPRRLLGIGLPLTILFGTACAIWLFTELPLWQAAVLATVLAPTDAALAQAVINSKRVPHRIREAINVESGLNDGICFPILLLFLSLASHAETSLSGWYWLAFISSQLLLGPIIGSAVGFLGGKITLWSHKRGWMSETFQRLSMIALATMAYCFAEILGGNGFIASFFAGLFFGNAVQKDLGPIQTFGQSVGELFILLTFVLFGAILVPEAIYPLDGRVIFYSLLSLTVVRMAPVAISLVGKGLSRASILYLGWFGPRGAASILYLLLVVEKYNLSGEEAIFQVASAAILLSVLLHGITAVWGSNRYARAIEALEEREKSAETKPHQCH